MDQNQFASSLSQNYTVKSPNYIIAYDTEYQSFGLIFEICVILLKFH